MELCSVHFDPDSASRRIGGDQDRLQFWFLAPSLDRLETMLETGMDLLTFALLRTPPE